MLIDVLYHSLEGFDKSRVQTNFFFPGENGEALLNIAKLMCQSYQTLMTAFSVALDNTVVV